VFDDPPGELLAEEVAKARAAGLTSAFAEKVAANALGIAVRERELGPALNGEERERLIALLRRDGNLRELNAALAAGLRDGTLALADEAVAAHLIRTAIGKLSVDQPSYPGFRALVEKGAGDEGLSPA
jgi:hypothetical protein